MVNAKIGDKFENEFDHVIYMHLNKINNKKYIGLTKAKPYTRRWRGGSSYKKQPKFFNAILKYGWENFEHIILYENLSKTEALNKEIEEIKLNNSISNGYNVTKGGKGCLGKACSEETKKKISKANKGRKPSSKAIELARQKNKGKPSWNKGKKLSYEHWLKVSEERKKRCNKKIYAIDIITKNIIFTFSSCVEASKFANVTKSNISRCAKGGRPTCAGYIWKYANE